MKNFLKNKMARRALLSLAITILAIGGVFVYHALALTSITLVSPNGGEKLSGTQNITWSSAGTTDTVNIYYSTDNFVGISTLIASDEIDDGTYAWDTSSLPDGTNYRIRVRATSDVNVYDTSNADFTIDNTHPIINSITSNATAAGVLKVGNSIVFTLTPSATEAGATVAGSYNSQSLTWSTGDGGATYTATYTVTEGENDQSTALQITGVTITDAAGNVSAAADGSDIVKTIDANTPTLTSVSIASDNTNTSWAATGDLITLTFVASENLTASPVVTIAGNAADAVTAPVDAQHWTATYTMAGGDTAGVVSFTIDFSDIATNAGTQVTAVSDATSVTYDKTSPSIAFTQNVEAGPVASDTISLTVTETNGNTATYYYGFSADGICDGTDTYDVAYVSATPFVINTETNNTKYICAKAVDMAGNVGYSAASANDLNIDVTPPTVALTYSPNRTLMGLESVIITATFTDANAIDEVTVPKIAIATNGDGSLSAVNMTKTSNTVWTYTWQVPGGSDDEGTATVTITATDEVGNPNATATNNTRVIDTISPAIGSVTLDKDQYRLTQDPTVTAVIVEDNTASTVTVNGETATESPAGTWTGSFTHGKVAVGTYSFNVVATDAYGNIKTQLVQYKIVADNDAAAPAGLAITTADATVNADYYTIAGTITADTSDVTVQVLNGSNVVGTVVVTAGQTAWSAIVALPQSVATTFTARATDAAGNAALSTSNGTAGLQSAVITEDAAAGQGDGTLAVTGISTTRSYATANDTWASGWAWTFNITVPTSETNFAMKFDNWTSGANTIAAADNIRFYTAQSTAHDTTGESVIIDTAGTDSTAIVLDGDADANTEGRQIVVTVEAKVPTGSAGGSYSTQYGVTSEAPLD